jgi:hypothetical protein
MSTPCSTLVAPRSDTSLCANGTACSTIERPRRGRTKERAKPPTKQTIEERPEGISASALTGVKAGRDNSQDWTHTSGLKPRSVRIGS